MLKIIHNTVHHSRQTQEHYLITEFKNMEDVKRPEKDSRIKLQVLWLNNVNIQEVDQSAVGFLSKHKSGNESLQKSVSMWGNLQ